MGRRWLGTLVLTPLLLGGCGSGAERTEGPTPSGSPWVVVAAGQATPSPVPSRAPVPRSTFPRGFLPLPSAKATATATPTGTCTADSATPINSAAVVPGATRAAVTFFDRGGNELVEYRVTAISQDLNSGAQRDVGWTVITPGPGCGYLTATVTGLDRRTDYVFSVDAVTTNLGRDGTRAATVARSLAVRTT